MFSPEPQWRRDQSEIFYIAPDHMLVAVPIDLGPQPALGTARRLFRAPVTRGPDNARDNYAATPDGGTRVTYHARFDFRGIVGKVAPLLSPVLALAFKRLGDEAQKGLQDNLDTLRAGA